MAKNNQILVIKPCENGISSDIYGWISDIIPFPEAYLKPYQTYMMEHFRDNSFTIDAW